MLKGESIAPLYRALGIAFIILLMVPAIVHACPTCFAASGSRGLHAYYLSTVLLSTMPFLLIGMIAALAYVARRGTRHSLKRIDRGEG